MTSIEPLLATGLFKEPELRKSLLGENQYYQFKNASDIGFNVGKNGFSYWSRKNGRILHFEDILDEAARENTELFTQLLFHLDIFVGLGLDPFIVNRPERR